MAFCKYCGGRISNEAVFCKHCGEKINKKEQVAEIQNSISDGFYLDGNYGQTITVYDDYCRIYTSDEFGHNIVNLNLQFNCNPWENAGREREIIHIIDRIQVGTKRIAFSNCIDSSIINMDRKTDGYIWLKEQSGEESIFFFDGKVPRINEGIAYLYYNVFSRVIVSKKNYMNNAKTNDDHDFIEQIKDSSYENGFTRSENELLEKLKALKNKGIINEREYEKKKKKILKI